MILFRIFYVATVVLHIIYNLVQFVSLNIKPCIDYGRSKLLTIEAKIKKQARNVLPARQLFIP